MKGRSIAEVLAGAVVLLVAFSFLAYAVTNSGRGGFSGPALTLTAKFDRIDGLAPGADVRVAGVKVGSVVDQRIDPQTFLAILTMRIDASLRMPTDSSAEIASEGLLGGRFVSLVPGGADETLADGGQITITQSAISLESLLGRFIFSMTEGQPRSGADQPAAAAPAAPSGLAPLGTPPAGR
ncbi:outer membrane lipid asymmetry maintenance protein MlaD [Falsiroseomonas selenitidurans]|uniref:Outer membrane lipid asymmetry maintenance protein MlaD n=1 Tax=Falsiroseomonas selenitidurans TaxID=2716335 RepID=A0ABX1EB42_9PROT|nr:outer membrane lipid asymmetry maintenance protein MlaD [Falsiroseomonas selenitidurans]NKC34442.1 outer membrane lipid asymmetry maintenance protein MlaD [Falsiroseomonas selenitidurans]OYW10582.1 MAG: outer membrane lipid asymmetry maintenance protein MlaD [Rhodospirillales bacterium 12-71-4]